MTTLPFKNLNFLIVQKNFNHKFFAVLFFFRLDWLFSMTETAYFETRLYLFMKTFSLMMSAVRANFNYQLRLFVLVKGFLWPKRFQKLHRETHVWIMVLALVVAQLPPTGFFNFLKFR